MATFLGVLLALAWPVGLAACATWLAAALALRISSLAALVAALATPAWCLILGRSPLLALALALTLLVFWRHRQNIERLLAGTEPRIGGGREHREGLDADSDRDRRCSAQAVRDALRNYATFRGRAPRPQFWWFVLFVLAGGLICDLLDRVLFGERARLLGPVFSLATLVPLIAISVRRLHDIGRTGWWVLLHLVPVIGLLVMIYFYLLRGDRGSNRFGPPPPPLNAR